jgi:hypothetical protein
MPTHHFNLSLNQIFALPRLVMLAVVFTLASCGEVVTVAYLTKIIDTEEAIERTIGDARCASDNQCKVLYLRSVDSCGPDIAVPFSDANQIESTLNDLESRRRDYIYQNILLNGIGTYCFNTPRQLRNGQCVNERCLLK